MTDFGLSHFSGTSVFVQSRKMVGGKFNNACAHGDSFGMNSSNVSNEKLMLQNQIRSSGTSKTLNFRCELRTWILRAITIDVCICRKISKKFVKHLYFSHYSTIII